ncbi:ATP-grasp domain-containing protein [Pseudomonas sp. H9]|uniref:ATP-grasp domain-containing protein n=1 Tax=Pseudomonas sp. H9 TaxID=483968 RepID=UPI001057DBE7|nr:ATP-grasp domain-containing protein [Pseudomonas sp. H9]TDF84099.1 ATP-grasp domain-containing protein [Pseudomonas sp. H9]
MTNPCIDANLAPLVLVDAYSTGALLARALAEQRPLLHVSSRSDMPQAFAASCPQALFLAHYNLQTLGFQALVEQLKAHQPAAVITGSEFGVELADRLAAALELPGNDPEYSAARRDKSLMAEQVACAGLPVAAQLRTASCEQAVAWFQARGARPVVVKPLDSAGSDNVFICHDIEQLQLAVACILGATNLMMCNNHALLLQEYLEGDEYIINSVSHEGQHWITDVWKSSKTLSSDGRKIYDCEDLLPAHDPVLVSLIDYVQGVLDALAIAHGPAHTEVILTAQGPRLLETGARLSGLANPEALQAATGNDQVALTCLKYLQPHALARHPQRYRLLNHCCTLNLISRRSAPFNLTTVRQQLDSLGSYHSARFRFSDGRHTVPTIDLNSSPGAVFLLHPSADRIRQDHQAWRVWEKNCL